jgi:hypothetical protein
VALSASGCSGPGFATPAPSGPSYGFNPMAGGGG